MLFKILCAMLAQGADIISREIFSLVNIAADLADPACLLLGSGCGLGLNMVEVVLVSHTGNIVQHLCFGQISNEQGVRAPIVGLYHLAAEHAVGNLGDITQAVFGKENGLFTHNAITIASPELTEENHKRTKRPDEICADMTNGLDWYGAGKCATPNKDSKRMTAPVIEGNSVYLLIVVAFYNALNKVNLIELIRNFVSFSGTSIAIAK